MADNPAEPNDTGASGGAKEISSRRLRPEQPHLRLIRGNASPEEIAAIVAVLATRTPSASGGETRRGQRERESAWADPALAMRQYTHPAAGAWRRWGDTPGTRTRADW